MAERAKPFYSFPGDSDKGATLASQRQGDGDPGGPGGGRGDDTSSTSGTSDNGGGELGATKGAKKEVATAERQTVKAKNSDVTSDYEETAAQKKK